MELNRYPTDITIPEKAQINVCLGKDWYRYPGSFFLPNPNWNVRFIQSEFKGILPAPYTEGPNGTTIIHKHFNDKNLEETSLYFDINKCHFLLDLDLDKYSDLEPNYSSQKDKWRLIKDVPFLNTAKSHRVFRAFYVPFVNDYYTVYGNFSLLQTTKWKWKWFLFVHSVDFVF